MKKYYFILMLLAFLNCYKFEESPFDSVGIFSLIRAFLSSSKEGYTNFMMNRHSAFRKANTDTYVSYIRRNFGYSDNPKNRIDLIVANENSTDMIPTNIPMVGNQVASMIGYGYNPANTNNRYSILFEVKSADTSGVSTYEYYYWAGFALPQSGNRMTFAKVFPAISGEKIVGFGAYNVGVVEKGVFCEQPISTNATTCYNVDSDFTNRITIPGPISTNCTYVAHNNAVGWCVDSISGASYSFYVTDGTATAFGINPVALVANYKSAPFDTFAGTNHFDIQPDLIQSHYIEHTNDSIRITTTPGDITSLGPLTSPGNSNQQVVSATSLLATDVIEFVRSFNVGPVTFLSFVAIPSAKITPSTYLYRSADVGVSWTRISQEGLALPAPQYDTDPVPSYTAALGVFGTNSGTEKLHSFVNGSALKRYVSIDDGTTWVLQEKIPLTSE
ncbi:hypothetical protein M9Y82_13170 [Leptospira weilii]|uniref:LIC11996 family lipoprotein n=1 Tax=Leptospira weilii TaxID=28184 RepID=UPI0020231AF3|nr:hypothetical protein [Leptospira weilii]MCL8267574.1 hypothetical protein [Leptospira weilii]MDL5244751.1 hypothetical protein [Leptospira weilii]